MTTKLTIWTWGYFPLKVGGSPHQAIKCEIEVEDDPIDIGGGFKGYEIVSPRGTPYVAESTSGALIGPTIEEVRKDVESGDTEMMQRQVADSIDQRDRAKEMSAEAFWENVR